MKDIAKDKNKQKTEEEERAESLKWEFIVLILIFKYLLLVGIKKSVFFWFFGESISIILKQYY